MALMVRIRNAVSTRLPAIHADKLGRTDYAALGKTIDGVFRSSRVEGVKALINASAPAHAARSTVR